MKKVLIIASLIVSLSLGAIPVFAGTHLPETDGIGWIVKPETDGIGWIIKD